MRNGGQGDKEEKRGGKRRRVGKSKQQARRFFEGGQSRTYGKDIDKDVRFGQLRIYCQE